MAKYEFIRRAIVARYPAWQCAGMVALAVLVPTLLRWLLGPASTLMPFVTYYPAVLLVAVLCGWRWAALTTVASAIVANRVFMPEPLLTDPTPQRLALLAFFALSCAVLVATGETLRRTLLRLEEIAAEHEATGREMFHRVQNVLAVVEALARTGDGSQGIERFREDLSGRVAALAAANQHLWDAKLHQRPLRSLVELGLRPFAGAGRFHLEGGERVLTPQQGHQLLLILHELGTNALKHGALTQPGGRVDVRWNGAGEPLAIEWIESGGPAVSPPTRRGLGTRLMGGQHALGVEADYARAGLRCRITTK